MGRSLARPPVRHASTPLTALLGINSPSTSRPADHSGLMMQLPSFVPHSTVSYIAGKEIRWRNAAWGLSAENMEVRPYALAAESVGHEGVVHEREPAGVSCGRAGCHGASFRDRGDSARRANAVERRAPSRAASSPARRRAGPQRAASHPPLERYGCVATWTAGTV